MLRNDIETGLGVASDRRGAYGSAVEVPGNAGVPPALDGGRIWTTRRRPTVVQAGGTLALPEAHREHVKGQCGRTRPTALTHGRAK